jgi:hypothetical protein
MKGDRLYDAWEPRRRLWLSLPLLTLLAVGVAATVNTLVDAKRNRESVLGAKDVLPSAAASQAVRIDSIVILLRDVRETIALLDAASRDGDARVAEQARVALRQIREGR